MSSSAPVELAVYDLSHGMAKQFLSSMIGIEVEAIYHTGVRVFGYEYFFSDGIQKMTFDQVKVRFGMSPIEIIPMGNTALPEEVVEQYLDGNRDRFSAETYDLLNHNCNNFSEEFVNFLTGNSIPSKILNLPQMLLNTPQGKMIAPLLEQMGITRAIPLSTSDQPAQPHANPPATLKQEPKSTPAPSQPTHTNSSTEMDLSCLQPWTRFAREESLTSIYQRCFESDASLHEIAQLCNVVHESKEPCFYCVEQLLKFISECCKSPVNEPLVLDILVILVPHIPVLVSAVEQYKKHTLDVLSSLTALLVQLILTNPLSERVMDVAVIGMCALFSPMTWPYLKTFPELGNLFSLSCTMDKDVPLTKLVKTCFLATCCGYVDVSGNGSDGSEESLKLLNVLTQNITEEKDKEILKLRIAGLYLLVKRGSDMEKLTVQSQGLMDGFLTESALIPQKSKEIKIDPGITIGLQSIIAEQERKLDQEEFIENPRKRQRHISENRRKKEEIKNPGVEERNRKDLEEDKAPSKAEKLKKLRQKAELFRSMQRGDIQPDDSSLVDFKKRKEMYDFYGLELPEADKTSEETPEDPLSLARDRYVEMLNEPHKKDEELIEDEFGRLRWVKRGSDDYMNYIGSAYRIRQELKGKTVSSGDQKKTPMSKAARVKMTWENQMNRSERDYFVEIDNETEQIKRQKAQKKTAVNTTVRSKKDIADDMLRALL